jgi:hypothetical protein
MTTETKVVNEVNVPCILVAHTYKPGVKPRVFHVPVQVVQVVTVGGRATEVKLVIGERIEYLPAECCTFENEVQECPEGLTAWFD